MKPTIVVQHRQPYGTPRIYPVNELAHVACELIKKKTLDDDDLRVLERMGFAVEWVPSSEKLNIEEIT